ncbi:hypothetical protein [uncultured Megasphaera sp.]|uniref:hypothetical protein n=1 Tax=uncultured Megasphaera sp. TaxID=165188 RepID=UPI002628F8BA|nr:hypothetical protein [uncultured Megasphaera sp.]
MFNEYLPQGKDALLFDDIRCNVAGLFLYSKVLIDVIKIIEYKFSARLPISEIYGSLPVRWNSGRLLLSKQKVQKDIKKEFMLLKENHVTPVLTFSNPVLKKTDLDDFICNELLENIAQIDGIVIVSSDLLYEYIKQKYPSIKIEASIIKTALLDKPRTVDYYNNLSEKFFKYVVHVNDNFNAELLKKINKDNAEIILNERCYNLCPIRKDHYLSIANEQISQCDSRYKDSGFLTACEAIPEKKQLYSKKRNISMTFDEYKKIYELGFRNYKIQGRTNGVHTNIFDLLRFTLEPSVAFTQAFPIISEYIDEVQ